MDSTFRISCSLAAKVAWITTSLLMVTRIFQVDQVEARQHFSLKQISQILTWTECQMKLKIVSDLHSADAVPYRSLWIWRAIYKYCQNFSIIVWSSFHLSPLVWCFVYNKSTVRFVHSFEHTEHYILQMYYLARTKHDCTLARCFFNYSISDTFLRSRTADSQPQKIFTFN